MVDKKRGVLKKHFGYIHLTCFFLYLKKKNVFLIIKLTCVGMANPNVNILTREKRCQLELNDNNDLNFNMQFWSLVSVFRHMHVYSRIHK